MNLPNKLTVLRIALVPVFMVLAYLTFPCHMYAALAVFILASLTDFLDGYLARKLNLITDFGKFMDSLADKILVLAALIWLVEADKMPGWCLFIVMTREFAVTGLRLVAANTGRVIAAGWSGKVKTASTMVCLCVMHVTVAFQPPMEVVDWVCVIIIAVTTLYSGVEYFAKNKDVLNWNK